VVKSMSVKTMSMETTCSYSVRGREAIEAPAHHDDEVSWGGRLGWQQQHMTMSTVSMPTHNFHPSSRSKVVGSCTDVILLALLTSLTLDLLQISNNRIDLIKR
jgi:hypothetical protein